LKRENYYLESLKGKAFQVSLDSLEIGIDSLSMNPYFIYDKFKDDLNDDNIFVGYNVNVHTLDFFSFGKRKLIKRLFLTQDGIGAINEVLSFDFYNWDSIFVYSRAQLKVIDSSGIVRSKFNLIDNDLIDYYGEPVADFYFNLEYLKERKSILFYNVIYPPSLRSDRNIVSEFNLPSGEFTSIPIRYSKYFVDNNANVGHLAYLSKENVYDNKITYNFLYESNIYVYDLESGKTTAYGGNSTTANPLATTFDVYNNQDNLDWQKHAIANPHYFQVLPDKFRKLYYRLHWLPATVSSPIAPSAKDKDLVLMVFDEEFNVVYESLLPTKTYRIHHWFVTEEGLFLSPTHPDIIRNENLSTWHVYKFTSK